MDIGGTAKAVSPESTVVIEKSVTTTEVSEKPAASPKKRSFPDSSADSTKDSAYVADSLEKHKEASQATLSSAKQASDDVAKVDKTKSIAEVLVNPLKQPAVTTSTLSEISQTDCESIRNDAKYEDKLGREEHIDEDDELLKRMEAIEKGEDLDAVSEDANHQNGMPKKTPKKEESGKATDECVNVERALISGACVSMLSESDAASKSAEAVSPTFKRKHPFTMGEVEPQVKKVHIADVVDGPEYKAASSEKIPTETTVRQPSEASTESPGCFEPDLHEKEKKENPPSVEKMEVDGSPEPEASSPRNVEMLPDTESNTTPDTMDEKSEEISSSVVEEPMRQAGDSAESNKTEHSNVSSSDDKRESITSENMKRPDSEVSASVLPASSVEEAMDVDEDEIDMAESSTPIGPVASAALPVVEPPCVTKVAYLCGDENAKRLDDKCLVISTEKPTAASEMCEATKQKDLDTASKTTSSSVPCTKPDGEPENVVDSSNIFSTVQKLVMGSEPSYESLTLLDERVVSEESTVESSQPSSSSDMKKHCLEGKRSGDQIRELVHQSALLAKGTSSPNPSTVERTSSSSNVSAPKTLNTVMTSTVSSSNVYSSIPIHPRKLSSGNVNKITNLPSSIESSGIEADDTTTTTTIGNDQSESPMKTETGEKNTDHTKSATISLPSTTETLSSPTTATMGTTDSSTKSTVPQKELKHEDSSSSKASLKTSDDISEVDSCTVASEMNTTEEINMYVSNARKLNGISSTSEGSDLGIKDDMTKSVVSIKLEDAGKASTNSMQLDLSRAISPTSSTEQQYEVSIWYEGKELQFMSVERIHGGTKVDPSANADSVIHDASDANSSLKQSSTTSTNGSVSSIGPFALPGTKPIVGHSSNSSSPSVTLTGVKSTHSVTVPQMKQTVMGPKALCDLVIEEFQKLRRAFAPDDTTDDDVSTNLLKSPKTPYIGRGRKDSAKKSGSRAQKRSKAADSEDEEDDASNDSRTPRTAGSSASKQQAKRTKVVLTGNESSVACSSTIPKSKILQEPKQFDICCLARWTDRKYYAGRVTNYREDNKYVVLFEDGCSKTLSRDIIVFGEDGVLPIQHHSIHVLTGGDTYEPAIVEEIKRNDGNDVVYCVRTASSSLEVTATDIYLTDEQAKWIHNACKDKPDPIQKLLQSGSGISTMGRGRDAPGNNQGNASEGKPILVASNLEIDSGDKGSRSTRSKRGAGVNDKAMGSTTPEAGYSGGIGKKGRRGRRLS